MTRDLLDTNTVSHLLNKHPEVPRRVVAVPVTSLCIPALTQGERWFGLAKRPDATALHSAVREQLRRVDTLPWDSATAETCGQARPATRREGRVLVPKDLLTGAHALSIDAMLVTNDRAFGQLSGLTIEDWTDVSRQGRGRNSLRLHI